MDAGSPSYVIGNTKSFWTYSAHTGFDLTHPPHPDSPPVEPRLTIQTAKSPISIDPAKSALVIIDMQNFFLSSALGRARGAGHDAVDKLAKHAVPACREAGVRVLWVNWGLTDKDIEEVPVSMIRSFGFRDIEDGVADPERHQDQESRDGHIPFQSLGKDMGTVKDSETGKEVDAGKMLMRDMWNTDLYSPLNHLYAEGSKLPSREDVWIHKNRPSAMWGHATDLELFLEKEGLTTLFFAGVNTDQCVAGSLMDSYYKGYDCIMLSDGCGTTSPDFAQQCIEYNAKRGCGFLATCEQLAESVAQMKEAPA